MGITYFNISDGLNFNGSKIKIKTNAEHPLEKKETNGRAYFDNNSRSGIVQSVLASQAQVHAPENLNNNSADTSLRVLNSTVQAGRVNISASGKNKYTVIADVSLNKVTTGAADRGAAKTQEIEKIVVSGLQVGGNFKYQFIETALHDIDVLTSAGTDPAEITWVVFVHDYVYEPVNCDREHFTKTADTLGINIVFVENKIQFINYINAKATHGLGKQRDKVKISYLSVFAHGQTPRFTGGYETQLSIAYGLNSFNKGLTEDNLEGSINFIQSDIAQLNTAAFGSGMLTKFYTCNTGTADTDGKRFAQLWADKTCGDTYAYTNARSNYVFINSTMDQINAAFNFPTSKFDVALSDIINGLREKSHELLDEPSTEILTSLLGESNRETAEYIAQNIITYPVSEEWEIKQERKADRQRVDEQGKKYGYAVKGSLQYPMLNNLGDDLDIIIGTWQEGLRGYLLFTPTKGRGAGRSF